jgi:RimJ/RimL family protein N-acetyltransferase
MRGMSVFCELTPEAFSSARPLFRGLEYHMMSAASISGRRRARIFADDTARPGAAFIFTPQIWGYLAGKPGGGDFADRLGEEIFAKHILGKAVTALFVATDPDDWWEQLVRVLGPFVPIPASRLYYVCTRPSFDWREIIPEGFSVERVTEEMMSHPDFELPHDAMAWIKEWGGPAAFLEGGFGFVAWEGDRPVSWSFADAVIGQRCEIGIYTEEGYRKRGLGAATSGAAVEYAFSTGIKQVGWHCAAENEASMRTAERVGFRLEREYEMHLIVMDEARHRIQMKMSAARLAENGEVLVNSGDYQQAAGLYDTVLALDPDIGPEHYHLAARALAGAGRLQDAMEYLYCAADRGWQHTYHTRTSPEFEGLRSMPGWREILKRIEENRRAGSAG